MKYTSPANGTTSVECGIATDGGAGIREATEVGVGVGEDANVAVAEEVIGGEAGAPSGDGAGMTGLELQATLPSNVNSRITRNPGRICHLTSASYELISAQARRTRKSK